MRSSLRSLVFRSTGLSFLLSFVLLPLAPITLLQTLHAGLTHFDISREEGVHVIGLDDGAELHLVFVLLASFLRLRLAVRCSHK